jgi:hypothetical protein
MANEDILGGPRCHAERVGYVGNIDVLHKLALNLGQRLGGIRYQQTVRDTGDVPQLRFAQAQIEQ